MSKIEELDPAETLVAPVAPKPVETWINTKWRPMMGWLYMTTCGFDFVVAPIAWALLQTYNNVSVTQWNPLTLQGAGLYHLAMGAVLGVAAWSRGQEKMSSSTASSTMPPALPRRNDN